MPSYLERDQLIPVAPYVEDTDSILRGFQTKLQYWGMGASKVKSAYQSYLGMELTRDDNQQQLNSFMESAKSQIQKAASTDLSVGDNVSSAMQIFDPLTNSDEFKAVRGDNALTKFYKEQYKIADQFKNKDGGKEFSETNLRDVQQQHMAFKNDSDPNNWEKYYNSKRQYTPYIDVKEKVQKLIKDFYDNEQFDQITSSSPSESNQAYLITEENKSVKAEKLKMYIANNLSEKEKNQLAIESRVHLNDNISIQGREAVAKSFYNSYIENVKLDKAAYEREAQNISDNIKLRESQKLTDSQRRLLDDEKTRLKLVENEIAKKTSQIATFVDPKTFVDFDKQLESKAYEMYVNDFTTGLANANSRTNYSQKVSQNAAYFSQLGYELNLADLNRKKERDAWEKDVAVANAESNRINALKSPSGKKTKEEVMDENGNPKDPNKVIQTVSNNENVTGNKEESYLVKFAGKISDIESGISKNKIPLRDQILSKDGELNDAALYDKFLQDNKDKYTTLKVKDMPETYKNIFLRIFNNGVVSNTAQANEMTLKQVDEKLNEKVNNIILQAAQNPAISTYGGLDLKQVVTNHNRLVFKQQRYMKDLEEAYNAWRKGENIKIEKPFKEVYNTLISSFGRNGQYTGKAILGLDSDFLNISSQTAETFDKYLQNLPYLRQAQSNKTFAIKLENDEGAAFGKAVASKVIEQIKAQGKDNRDVSGGNIIEISMRDQSGDMIDGATWNWDDDELNANAKAMLSNVNWDADKSPLTEMKYVKGEKEGEGAWEGSVAVGTGEKTKYIHFKYKAPTPSYLSDDLRDDIISSGMNYTRYVDGANSHLQFRSVANSNNNELYGFYVSKTVYEPMYEEKDGKKYLTGFNRRQLEDQEVPQNVNLTDYEVAYVKQAETWAKQTEAFDAFMLKNKRYPTAEEFEKELKTAK